MYVLFECYTGRQRLTSELEQDLFVIYRQIMSYPLHFIEFPYKDLSNSKTIPYTREAKLQ